MTAPSEALCQIVQWADAYLEKEAYEPISEEELALATEALARVGIDIGSLTPGDALHIH